MSVIRCCVLGDDRRSACWITWKLHLGWLVQNPRMLFGSAACHPYKICLTHDAACGDAMNLLVFTKASLGMTGLQVTLVLLTIRLHDAHTVLSSR